MLISFTLFAVSKDYQQTYLTFNIFSLGKVYNFCYGKNQGKDDNYSDDTNDEKQLSEPVQPLGFTQCLKSNLVMVLIRASTSSLAGGASWAANIKLTGSRSLDRERER